MQKLLKFCPPLTLAIVMVLAPVLVSADANQTCATLLQGSPSTLMVNACNKIALAENIEKLVNGSTIDQTSKADFILQLSALKQSVVDILIQEVARLTSQATPPNPQRLQLTSPAAASSLTIGSTYPITWTWNGSGVAVATEAVITRIPVTDSSAAVSATVPNNGRYSWNISSARVTPGDYVLKVCALELYCDQRSVSIISAPAPVGLFSLAATAGDGRAILSWAGGNIVGFGIPLRFKIFRGGTDVFSSATLLNTVPAHSIMSYSDSNLENGRTYYYWVQAVNEDSVSSRMSSVVSATPRAPTPATLSTPAGLTAAISTDTITLSWNAVSGAASYKIFYNESPSTVGRRQISAGGVTTPSWSVSVSGNSLVGGTTYYFWVVAVNASGRESPFSNLVSATTLAVENTADNRGSNPVGTAVTPSPYPNLTYIPSTRTLSWAESLADTRADKTPRLWQLQRFTTATVPTTYISNCGGVDATSDNAWLNCNNVRSGDSNSLVLPAKTTDLYYRVRAVWTSGGESEWSEWVRVEGIGQQGIFTVRLDTASQPRTISAGSMNENLATFVAESDRNDGTAISALSMRLSGTLAPTQLTNCTISNNSGTVLTTGGHVVNPSSANVIFTFDSPSTVAQTPNGGLLLKCNVAPTANGTVAWTLIGVTSTGPSTASGAFPLTAPTVTVVSGGRMEVALDPISPSSLIESQAGTLSVIVAVLRVRAINEPISLQKLGLQLTSGSAADLNQVSIWDGDTQTNTPIGTAVFTGANRHATSTLINPVIILKDTDKTLIVKVDLAQAASVGNIVAVNWNGSDPDGTQGVGMDSGNTIKTTGVTTSAPGVRIVASSQPTLATPANLTVIAGDKQATITWSPVPNAAGYYIVLYRNTADIQPVTGAETGLTQRSLLDVNSGRYVDSSLNNNTVYYYWIRAVKLDMSVMSPISSPSVSVRPLSAVAPAPTLDLKVNGSAGSISVPYDTSVRYTWTSDAEYCLITNNWQNNARTGMSGEGSTGNLKSSTVISLSCVKNSQTTTKSVAVSVAAAPALETFPKTSTQNLQAPALTLSKDGSNAQLSMTPPGVAPTGKVFGFYQLLRTTTNSVPSGFSNCSNQSSRDASSNKDNCVIKVDSMATNNYASKTEAIPVGGPYYYRARAIYYDSVYAGGYYYGTPVNTPWTEPGLSVRGATVSTSFGGRQVASLMAALKSLFTRK